NFTRGSWLPQGSRPVPNPPSEGWAHRSAADQPENIYGAARLQHAPAFGSWRALWPSGHRWNPKMAEYIFGTRNNIHIIDLTQSVPMMHRALQAISDTVAQGGRILFV